MFFLMECRHHPGMEAERDAARPLHRDWVASGGNGLASVLIGSALLDSTGTAAGHWGVLEAASEDRARNFAQGDPFATAGIVADIRLTRLADTFQHQRIADRMTRQLPAALVPNSKEE